MQGLIEKLENEIAHQTRNGRDRLYLEAEDLRKLGCDINKNKEGRTWVDLNYVIPFINRYKFKDSLKVETKTLTFKQLEEDIKRIEKER